MSCSYLEMAVEGDINDIRDVLLRGGGLGATDLVGATVVSHVWREGVAKVDLATSVLDAARHVIRVNLGAGGGWLASLAITEPTEYLLEYEVTFADGRVWTWPSGGPDRIVVRPQG